MILGQLLPQCQDSIVVIAPRAVRELIGMPPSLDDQFFVDEKEGKPAGNPEPQIIILAHRQALVKETSHIQNLPSQHDRRGADDAKG